MWLCEITTAREQQTRDMVTIKGGFTSINNMQETCFFFSQNYKSDICVVFIYFF